MALDVKRHSELSQVGAGGAVEEMAMSHVLVPYCFCCPVSNLRNVYVACPFDINLWLVE